MILLSLISSFFFKAWTNCNQFNLINLYYLIWLWYLLKIGKLNNNKRFFSSQHPALGFTLTWFNTFSGLDKNQSEPRVPVLHGWIWWRTRIESPRFGFSTENGPSWHGGLLSVTQQLLSRPGHQLLLLFVSNGERYSFPQQTWMVWFASVVMLLKWRDWVQHHGAKLTVQSELLQRGY